jgi:hypothetical protein
MVNAILTKSVAKLAWPPVVAWSSREEQPMPRTVTNETRIDDPALIEKVAIAIFEKTQGSWEYAREADREWLRLEAQAAIITVLKYTEERDRFSCARTGSQHQSLLELIELILYPPVRGGRSVAA